MKTCGSTLSNACSRSLIAYLAKSAAVAYGEVDCSSPKAFGATRTARLKQAARILLICKRRHLLSDSALLSKANFPVSTVGGKVRDSECSSKIGLLVFGHRVRHWFT